MDEVLVVRAPVKDATSEATITMLKGIQGFKAMGVTTILGRRKQDAATKTQFVHIAEMLQSKFNVKYLNLTLPSGKPILEAWRG